MATKIALANPAIVGQRATFGCSSDLPGVFRYHWLRNGEYIPGAQDKAYTTHHLRPEDMTAKYSVRVTGHGGVQEESNEIVFAPEVEKEAEDVGIV